MLRFPAKKAREVMINMSGTINPIRQRRHDGVQYLAYRQDERHVARYCLQAPPANDLSPSWPIARERTSVPHSYTRKTSRAQPTTKQQPARTSQPPLHTIATAKIHRAPENTSSSTRQSSDSLRQATRYQLSSCSAQRSRLSIMH